MKYEIGLVGAINAQRPNNKSRKDHEDYNKVLRKLDSLLKDERLSFMMKGWDGSEDPMPSVLAQILGDGAVVRIVDLSGVPNEIAGTASAAVARTLFSMKIWQSVAEREASPVVLVCEEAHRYVPNSGEAQYEAAQSAIKRIAKEGRKYGVGLFLVSQRPSEVETTVLSQCNSWIVLRITNEADRAHVRGVLPDSMAGLTKMLSGLRRQEAIFVGKLIIFNGFLVGAGAQHCQGQIRQRDRFATTMTIPTRNGDFGATRAGSEWPARRAHSTACPNA